MKIFSVFLFSLCMFVSQNLFSQCSDAGVCVIGKHQVNEFVVKKNIVTIGYIFGKSGKEADINGNANDLSFGTLNLEADIDISKGFRVNGSIPYTFVTGPLGENNGIGDLAVTFSKVITVKKKNLLTFFIGGKFATGKVNSNDSLPQRYMTGLGTNDLIAGAVFTRENYFFGIGYQKPFGRSDNYSTRLKRGDDLFFRAGFFEQFNKIGVKAEILTILRLQPSSVLNTASLTESFIEIDGSNETQVSLIGSASFRPSESVTLTGLAAIPFLKRNYNFDGLKRTLTISGMISYNF